MPWSARSSASDWAASWAVAFDQLPHLAEVDEPHALGLIHDFDFLRWTLGNIERVYACGVQGREYNRLDYALVTLRFEGGALLVLDQRALPEAVKVRALRETRRLVFTDGTEIEGLPIPRAHDAGP